MSANVVQLPIIAPSKGPSTDDEVRCKRQEMQAQAEKMDFTVPLPIEENSIDYSDQIQEKTVEVKIDEAKQANKQTISAKKAATLEKARAAKKEKKRLQELETNNVGDIMNRLIPTLNEHFFKVNQRLDDMKRIIGAEAPLQSQQIVPAAREIIVESQANPKTYLVQRKEYEDAIPIEERYDRMTMAKRKRPADSLLDENERRLYARRTNPQFKYAPYENVDTESRAYTDVSMGERAGLNPSGGKYVMF